MNAKCGTLRYDKAGFNCLSDKQTELQVTERLLKNVLKHFENHINLNRIGESDAILVSIQFIAAQFENIQMRTRPLSAAVIATTLIMIIHRLNDIIFAMKENSYQFDL